ATDGSAMYGSEREKSLWKHFPEGFGETQAAETFAQHLLGAGTDHLLATGVRDRERIFNLGYYTWVEQQGVSIGDFEMRRDQRFWRALRELIPAWDQMIDEFNGRTGMSGAR
ncbi:MAG TPA: pyridoxal-5'-phosphate-dependent protein subunit beta, partial [bacterium]|nr:pyridoxal-5'-phosphate-dependent protein subunit beta [bacterium]